MYANIAGESPDFRCPSCGRGIWVSVIDLEGIRLKVNNTGFNLSWEESCSNCSCQIKLTLKLTTEVACRP